MKRILIALVKFYRVAIFSLPAALLQLYAHLVPVCSGGH